MNKLANLIFQGMSQKQVDHVRSLLAEPIPMILYCPRCRTQHIDKSNEEEVRIAAAELDLKGRDWEDYIEKHEWTNPPHHKHLCAKCGHLWTPARVDTVGVAELPPV